MKSVPFRTLSQKKKKKNQQAVHPWSQSCGLIFSSQTQYNTTHSGSGKSGTPSSSRCVRRSECTSRLAVAGCKVKATSPTSGTSIFSTLILRFSFFSPFSRTRCFFLVGGATVAASPSCPASPLAAVLHADKSMGIRHKWDSLKTLLTKIQTQKRFKRTLFSRINVLCPNK